MIEYEIRKSLLAMWIMICEAQKLEKFTIHMT